MGCSDSKPVPDVITAKNSASNDAPLMESSPSKSESKKKSVEQQSPKQASAPATDTDVMAPPKIGGSPRQVKTEQMIEEDQ